jgi:hypothetical protein
VLRRAFGQGNVGARSWSVANPFVQPTFRYLLSQDSTTKVAIEVLGPTGNVIWRKDGPQQAGYHEVVWQAERSGRGPFGQGAPSAQGQGAQGQGAQGQGAQGQGAGPGQGGQGPGAGRGNTGPRPGRFVVRVTFDNQTSSQIFRVHDRRASGSIFGGWPGIAADASEFEQQAAEEIEPEPARGR